MLSILGSSHLGAQVTLRRDIGVCPGSVKPDILFQEMTDRRTVSRSCGSGAAGAVGIPSPYDKAAAWQPPCQPLAPLFGMSWNAVCGPVQHSPLPNGASDLHVMLASTFLPDIRLDRPEEQALSG